MKINFKIARKTWLQLTDGSVISSQYLFEKSCNKLDVDAKANKLWRFDLKNGLELSSIDKRIINFNRRFSKKKNNNK
jgi:hypothetical protein